MSKKARTFDLMFAGLGNGISVANRAREVAGDYELLAHISTGREVTYRAKNLPQEVKDQIEHYAATANPRVSTTQPQPVFLTPAS